MSGCRFDHRTTPWNWEQVLRWCQAETRRTLGAGACAEDAAQEAALRAWRRHGQCHSAPGRRAWVCAIARNEALRAVADRRPEEPLTERSEPRTPGGVDGATNERLDVWQALAGLGPSERKLIGLRYWADLTQAEAAERLGLPEGTVKVRLHRLRSTLRRQLAEA